MASTAASRRPIAVGQTRPKRRFLKRVLLVLLVALFAGVMVIGLWPVAADLAGSESLTGVGEGGGGLNKPFPAMVVLEDNAVNNDKNAERVALGKLLFFDPVMSGDNDMSCATCHHPDLGFTDARQFAMGKGGKGIGPDRAGGSATPRGAATDAPGRRLP